MPNQAHSRAPLCPVLGGRMSERFRNVAMFEEILGGRAVMKVGDQGPRGLRSPGSSPRHGVPDAGATRRCWRVRCGRSFRRTDRNTEELSGHASKKHPNVEPHGRLDASMLRPLKELPRYEKPQPSHRLQMDVKFLSAALAPGSASTSSPRSTIARAVESARSMTRATSARRCNH